MFENPDDIQSLKIIDFGLAIRKDDLPFSNCKCGTAGYIAPEMLN